MNNTRPNILLLFPDEHRGDWIPKNQNIPLRMPHLEKLMDTGTTFTRAITPSPLCAPARACLASGSRYDSCGVRDNGDCCPLDKKTFYTCLKESGYSVGGVGKFDLHKPIHWWGLDGFIEELKTLGFTHAIDNAGKMDAVNSAKDTPKDPYMKLLDEKGWREYHVADMVNREKKTHATKLPDELYCDNWIGDNALKMLKDFPKDAPWFLQVNFTGPHPPFDITEKMKEKWDKTAFPAPINWTDDTQVAQGTRQNYAAMLENIDDNIGRIVTYLEQTNQLDHTLIVYSSDHGEMLGDFNAFGKCRPEKASLNIPMIISGPGVCKGVVSDALIELQDLAKTFTDYAEADSSTLEDSFSLKDLLEGEKHEHREYVASALFPAAQKNKPIVNKKGWCVIEDKNYKMIMEEDGCIKLYDVVKDPLELNPYYDDEVIQHMKQYL